MWITNPPDYNIIEAPNGDKAFIHKHTNIGNLSIRRYGYIHNHVVLNWLYPDGVEKPEGVTSGNHVYIGD